MDTRTYIEQGRAVLGIEFGSTRIKAVLIDGDHNPIAQGGHTWENKLENGLWTYSLDDIWNGLQDCYAELRKDVKNRYGVELESFSAIGISAMMHGYLAFDAAGKLLAPFRTWRNTNTGKAAAGLSALFNFNVPLRWSISHLYQCILDGEGHVKDIAFQTTLAGYVHWALTGEKVIGVGDASGMIPVDSRTGDYDAAMVDKFNALVAPRGYSWKLQDIFPKVLTAGENAGCLTEAGAKLLDPSGHLKAGIPFCPPEGDAGTGMVATNSVRKRTGNVSAGTSSFSMIVLEKALSKPYKVIDMVTTPDGSPVAMVHCNNCTSEINAWVNIFKEFEILMGRTPDMGELYVKLFGTALDGDPDCGGVLSYNFVSGEPVIGLMEGKPVLIHDAQSRFSLSNLMRSQMHASVAVLKIGNEVLFGKENVKVDRILGHGGLFKSTTAGQRVLAAALNSPISVMETAGEGGAWGMALLAEYMVNGKGFSLADYLDEKVFKGNAGVEIKPTEEDVACFDRYMESYKSSLGIFSNLKQ